MVRKDLSGNGNNGSLAFMSTSSSPAIGKIGQALAFSETPTRKLNLGNVLHSTGAFTYSAWVYVTDFNTAKVTGARACMRAPEFRVSWDGS